MGKLLPNTTTDFNLTNNFGEGDLDIGWAHLQVMKLWELSSTDNITIGGVTYELKDTDALRNAIQKMYDINISANLAAPSLGDVYNPPEVFSSESYVKVWKMNDIFATDSYGKQPNINQPTTLYESVDGEMSGTISGSFRWARKGRTDKYLELFSGASVSLNDKRAVSGDAFPYCLSFSMYIKALGDGVLFRKGEFYMELKNDRILLKRNGFGKVISFKLPLGLSAGDLKNKWTEVRFIGQKVPNLTTGTANAEYQVYINNKECELLAQQYASTIRTADEKQPFVFSCNPIAHLQNVRISKSTLSFSETSEDFAYDISLDKASSFNYKIFENELLDNAGKKLGVFNFPGINNQSKLWTAKTGTGGPTVTNVAKLGANRYIKATDIDISKNFTISFWFKNISTTNNVVIFDADGGKNYFKLYFDTEKLKMQVPTKTYTINSSANYLEWTHLVLVKNGEGMGVYVNGELASYPNITGKFGTKTSVDINFGCAGGNKEPYYLSTLKIMKYAITHIGVSGWDNLDVDNKIERLMQNNF